jgi:hypothetical protein
MNIPVGILQQANNGGGATEISLVGYTTEGSGGTSMSVPSGMQAGDVLIHATVNDQGSPCLSTDGYTLITSYTPGPYGAMQYKVMGPTPDTSITWDTANSTGSHIAFAFRGVDTTNVLDVAISQANSTSGMPNCPSITPVNNGCCILLYGGLDDDVVASSVSAPSGFTLIGAVQAGTSGNGSTSMAAYAIQETAAAIDPAAFGGSGSDSWIAVTLALRAA